MNHRKVITTGCCDKSNVHKVVKLSFNRDFNADLYFKYNKLKPVWTSLGFTLYKEHIFESNVVVMYCPFCGVNVPEIEINEDAVKNHKIHESEDMNSCDTCNERNMCCECLPPEFRWKPVGIDIEIPINEFDDDDE
jgi:hypothetical protein